jgi:flavodoxin I
MEKIGLFYAPAKGSTERMAKLIQQKIGSDKLDLILIEDNSQAAILEPYAKIIFGISTVGRDNWDSNYKKIGWDHFLPRIENADFNNKTVAIFGLGNHILYPDNFVDAMGYLGSIVVDSGARLVGQTPIEGYAFSDSEAVSDAMFYGLPIDEDNEPQLSEQRINEWLKGISSHFDF